MIRQLNPVFSAATSVRSRMYLVVLMLCLTASMSMRTEAAPDSAADEVAAAITAWVEAYNTRDPGRLTPLYDQKAVFWGTTSKTLRTTPEAIAEYFRDSATRPWLRVAVDEQHIRVYGYIAINSGRYTVTDTRDGSKTPARFTFVYRQHDSKWLIIDHHSSRMPGS